VSCTASNRLVVLCLTWDTGPIHYWKLLQIRVALQKHKSSSNELDTGYITIATRSPGAK